MKSPSEPLLDMFRQHSRDELLLCYRGDFRDILTANLLEISRQNSVTKGDGLKLGKRMSLLLVECFQNIVRHGQAGDAEAESESKSFLCLRKSGGIYYLNTINPIAGKATMQLNRVLEELNALDKSSLKREYLLRLENNRWSEQGGAGLGLLEMARKSNGYIMHRTERFSHTHDMLHLQITIDSRGLECAIPENRIDDSLELFNAMCNDHSILRYKGEVSQQVLIQFIEISKHSFGSNAGRTREARKLTHTLIELLQNISKHSLQASQSSEGYLIIVHQSGNGFTVNAGNVLGENKKDVLQEKLRYLSQLSMNELTELHRKVLTSSLKFESKINTGLGLIEIFMAAKNKINYRIEPMDSHAFFGISVSV